MLLIMDWLSFIIVLFVGVISAILVQYCFYGNYFSIEIGSYEQTFYYIGLTIILGILFSRSASRFRNNLILNQQLEAVKTVTASIAHELRTPLLAIKSGVAGIKQFLPRLLESYNIGVENKLALPEIRPSQIKHIEKVIENINSEVDFSNDVITSLLTNSMHENISANPKLTYSMMGTVKSAILRYHFNSSAQADKVHFDEGNDFEYRGDETLVTHVIFNLLKNAIYAIEEMGKGEIFIRLAHEKNYNCLYFRDTAKGMSKETQLKLFELFYTEKPNSTGIGLAFSKMVVENLGGEISVDAVLNEYTEFVLKFPIIKATT
jgi:signal transduction histidine kinase